MLNKIFILNLIFIITSISSLCENTYSFSYEKKEVLENGKIYISPNSKNQETDLIYFIKSGGLIDQSCLYSWHGLDKHSNSHIKPAINLFGDNSENKILTSAIIIENNLLYIKIENNRFYLVLTDSTGEELTTKEIFLNSNFIISEKNICWAGRASQNEYLLQILDDLFIIEFSNNKYFKIRQITNNIISAIGLYDLNSSGFAYISNFGESVAVYYSNNNFNKESDKNKPIKLPYFDDIQMKLISGDTIGIISSNSLGKSFIQIISKNSGIIFSSWFDCYPDCISLNIYNKNIYVNYLSQISGSYVFNSVSLDNLKNNEKIIQTQLSSDLIEPIELVKLNKEFYAIFKNGIVTFDETGTQLSLNHISIGEYFNYKPEIYINNKNLILTNFENTLILDKISNNLWFYYRFYSESGKFIIPGIFILISLLLIFKLYNQRKLLYSVINLPSNGAVFVFDKQMRLIRTNDSGRVILSLPESIPMKKNYRDYFYSEELIQIKELLERAFSSENINNQKILLIHGGQPKEFLSRVFPIETLTGKIRGWILAVNDITEELERRRISTWAQLAHDMQTNLSTIRLNSELLELEADSENSARKRKISHQVGILIERVRDIVTVGRGEKLNLTTVSSTEICKKVLSEFDSSLFPNVKFESVTTEFTQIADIPKLIRALRNAVENSIRALENQSGTIIISCHSAAHMGVYSIEDNGIGMDETTKSKMMTPYFTTSSREGGFGIGTMIMQHVVELHNGKIEVHSGKERGTRIDFIIPLKYE